MEPPNKRQKTLPEILTFTGLPPEIHSYIAQKLDIISIMKLGVTCRRMNLIAYDIKFLTPFISLYKTTFQWNYQSITESVEEENPGLLLEDAAFSFFVFQKAFKEIKSLGLENYSLDELKSKLIKASLKNDLALCRFVRGTRELSVAFKQLNLAAVHKSAELWREQFSYQAARSVTSLTLSSNCTNTIPCELFTFKMLQKLYLHHNHIKILPAQIENLVSLKVLSVADNAIGKIPTTVGNLTNLETLELSNNNIRSLPKSIGNLTNLKYLYFDHNKLTELPDELFKLQTLDTLYLQDNLLTSVSPKIKQLTNLQMLILSKNRLSSIPKEIGHLSHLVGIYLENNQLRRLPDSLGLLTKLELLSVCNNELTKLPEELDHLANMKWLYACNNPLLYLSSGLKKLLRQRCRINHR